VPGELSGQLEELAEQEVTELANAYSDVARAREFLFRATRMDPGRTPWVSGGSAVDFWMTVNEQLRLGAVPDGRRKILARALHDYPANKVFQGTVAPSESQDALEIGDHERALYAEPLRQACLATSYPMPTRWGVAELRAMRAHLDRQLAVSDAVKIVLDEARSTLTGGQPSGRREVQDSGRHHDGTAGPEPQMIG
jgi:hypothetical protein